MTYDPITDIRLVEIIKRIDISSDTYHDTVAGYRIEYRRLGQYKESDWVAAPTIKEYSVNDRKDNPLSSDIQRSICEEDSSIS